METSYLNINGELIAASKAGLSVSNRAFRYGDGLFETIRIRNGKALFVDDHFERLSRGFQLLKMKAPNKFSPSLISREINRLLKQHKITKGARVRLNVYRDAEGLYTPESNASSWVMEVKTISTNAYVLNEKGLTLGIYKERRLMPDCFFSVKAVNRLPYILAGIYGKEQGWDDCLLENHNGTLMEAVSSNLFLVMGNTFYTPPLSDGCLPGIMRKQMIGLIKKMGWTVIENSIRTGHLETVDEVFLTNSVSGIRWVGAYEQKRYFHKKSDQLIEALNNLNA